MVSLRDADDDSIPAGVVRAYVSRLYQEIYDAAIAADHPHLEFSVLVPPSVNNKRNQGQDHGDPPRPSSWASRDVAALSPDVEVLLSDDPRCEDLHAKVNAERFRVGLSPLRFVSLESVAERAHNPEYFYAEDVLPETPVFSNVSCVCVLMYLLNYATRIDSFSVESMNVVFVTNTSDDKTAQSR